MRTPLKNSLHRHMFNLLSCALITFILLGILPHNAYASKAIALTLKVDGEAELKKTGTDKKIKLQFGTALDDGDWIKTSENGYVVLVFTDDKSQIKIKENTEVTIEGKRDAQSNIAKRVSMEVGELFAKVDQQRGSLQIATPTSVASVKGTEFWVVVYEDGTTEVVTLEGLVELVNRTSGQIVEVRRGETGTSDADGNTNVTPTPPDQQRNDPDQDGGQGDNGGGDGEPKTIEIRLEDRDGRPRTITIQYRD